MAQISLRVGDEEKWESVDLVYSESNIKIWNGSCRDIQRSTFDGIGKPEPLRTSSVGGGAGGLTDRTGLFTMSGMALSTSFRVVDTMMKLFSRLDAGREGMLVYSFLNGLFFSK